MSMFAIDRFTAALVGAGATALFFTATPSFAEEADTGAAGSVKSGMDEAGTATKDGINKGANATGEALDKAMTTTGEGIDYAIKKTGEGFKKAGEAMTGSGDTESDSD